ncbi:MAG TPA: hypothetical protein VFR37_17130 [Longimicrobium sp.]|nr:hypothetical protein [Longimicrobium sp.]
MSDSHSVPWPVWALVTLITAIIGAVAVYSTRPQANAPDVATPRETSPFTSPAAETRNAVATANCAFAEGLRSLPSRDARELVYANRHAVPVRMHWISPEGERRSYSEIPPEYEVRQPTFSGHYWIVSDAAGKCIELITVP